MLKTKKEIEKWLVKMWIDNYIINDDLTVDVDDAVYLVGDGLTEIPVQFGRIGGAFDCSVNQLTNLKGCPYFVGEGFYCKYNTLTSLEYYPEYVGEDFWSDIQDFTHEEYKQFVKLQKRKKFLNSIQY